jgi:nucleoside diphosphate kinase
VNQDVVILEIVKGDDAVSEVRTLIGKQTLNLLSHHPFVENLVMMI